MLSNLPPGVTNSMLPGSRPEDEEIEFYVLLTKGEVQDLSYWYSDKKRGDTIPPEIEDFLETIYEQICVDFDEENNV